MRVDLFVPGPIQNPLNGLLSRAHWTRKSKWANGWKASTKAVWWRDIGGRLPDRHRPKRVMFVAHVGAKWDTDNLPAAIKPIRDALIGLAIHSDGPDSGHEFVYRQLVDRKHRGVEITVQSAP